MRKELEFNSNKENITQFMTRAAEVLRLLKTGGTTTEGVCFKEELSEAEQRRFTEYVLSLAVNEMEKTEGRHCLRRNHFGCNSEDFISNFKLVIIKNLDKFNDQDHLAANGKKYCFSTFLKHLALEAVRMTYAETHGVSVHVERKFSLIRNLIKQIACEKEISPNEVTPEMIHQYHPKLSISDITAVLNYFTGKVSVEQMREHDGTEREVAIGKEDIETDVFDVLDYDVEKLLDLFFTQVSDVEKFFVLIETGCCDEAYIRKTSLELSVDDTLISIVAADKKLKKNISVGNIKIERPGRSSAVANTSVELKNVEFVSGNLIRYQRRKAVSTLKKLQEGIQAEDLVGSCGVEYFRGKWEELVERYW